MSSLSIYIAGPITGHEDTYEETFAAAAKAWSDAGWEVVNPAVFGAAKSRSEWREYMAHDIPLLIRCDAIAMLPNWQNSEGAVIEHMIANQFGLRIFQAQYPAKLPVMDHAFIEGTNICCSLPEYMHLPGWRTDTWKRQRT